MAAVRSSGSAPDLLQAGSELSSGKRRHRRSHRDGGSEVDRGSRVSRSRSAASYGSSYGSSVSRNPIDKGMTLADMQQHCLNMHMDRHIKELEKEAKEAAHYNRHWSRTVEGGLAEERVEKQRYKELCEINQKQLLDQIETNKYKRAEDRRVYIENASSHSFPLFTETFISEEEVEAYRKNLKKAWREELDNQATTQKMLRNLEEKKHHDQALQKQAENILNMHGNRGKEKERKKVIANNCLNSWDRDVRLKGIRKAIHSGVMEVNPEAIAPAGVMKKPGPVIAPNGQAVV